MKTFTPWYLVAVIYLVAFLESRYNGLFRWLGVRVDIIPCLITYASFRWSVGILAGVCIWAAMCFDCLSGNPFGITLLPLFLTGMLMQRNREKLSHEVWTAQAALGFAACFLSPFVTLLELFIMGMDPISGWITLWQLFFMGVAGAVACPLVFVFLEWTAGTLSYQTIPDAPFRSDREIKRGRS